MTIKEAKLFPFSLKLKTPFRNSNFTIDTREGFILKLEDEIGNIGFGECSPLTGFSKETLDEAEEELSSLIKNIKSMVPSYNFDFVNASVAFCFEQALFSLQFRSDENFKDKFVQTKKIKTNAVVGLVEINDAIEIISKKISSGFDTFKLKVGRDNPYYDFLLIEKVRELFGYDITLRLDANRTWNSDEAIEYLTNLQEFDIQFIEEPCDSLCGSLKTFENINIPIALDESLTDYDTAFNFIETCGIKYFVIKPMMIGFNSTLKLIKEANELGKYVIISSAFESSVGKSGLVFLASQTNHDFAHGLDTASFFEKDLVDDFYKSENSFIEFDVNNYPPKFNFHQ